MKFLSVCSGIEAASCAWDWEAVAFSEIEKFPSQVLSYHYPETPNWGDMTKFKEWPDANVDVLVGGTPCQSFSVAGLRKGLDDPRGNLMLTYLAIAAKYRPKWVVWENVPGVLSSNGGLDFASFLRGLGECGYGFAYRVLDAQYFGVPQRRRRVFVVGCFGDWRSAAAVLFECHSLSGNPAPSREKRQSVAASVREGASVGSLCARTGQSISVQDAAQGHLMQWPPEIAPTIDAHFGNKQGLENQHINGGGECLPLVSKCLITKNRMDAETETLIPTTGGHFNSDPVLQPAYGIPGNWIGRKPENGGNATEPMHDIAPCLTKADQHGVAQPMAYNISPGKGALKEDIHVTDANATKTLDASASNPAMHQGGTAIVQAVVAPTLTAANDPSRSPQSSEVTQQVYSVYQSSMSVRRLTPTECERLQGFPDNYTDIKSKGKPTPDGPRYKALGNSMAVPVMAWIGQRIKQVEQLSERDD